MILDIIVVIFLVAFFITLIYLEWTTPDMDDHPVHHDHRKGSFYSISQQVRRDEKKDRGY